MKDLRYRYFVRSGWEGRSDTPPVIGAKFLKTLDALSGIDPILANWKIIDAYNTSSFSLVAARQRIAAVIENNVARDDSDQPSPVYGYHAHALAGRFKDPRSVGFTVDAGGKFAGRTFLEFGEHDVAPDLTIVTYQLFKAALLAINAVWLAPWACAQAFRMGVIKVRINFGEAQAVRLDRIQQVPGDPTFPDSIFKVPWLAYLSAPLAADVKLTHEILTERTSDGGLLMSASTERLDPTNLEHVRRARILAETLIARTGHSSS
jgi:hypothetical protein